MASKDDERKALRKIRNIVDQLGGDSYIQTAFDGAFGLAERNIEDDAAFSASWYIDKVHLLQRDVPCYEKRIAEEKSIKEQLAKEIDCHKETITAQAITIHNQEDEITELMVKITNDSKANVQEINDKNVQISNLEYQITVLKAKLYDYFTESVADQLINN